MHAAALLTAMVTHGLIMPQVERYRMDNPVKDLSVIVYLRSVNIGVITPRAYGSHYPAKYPRHALWSDADLFKSPLPEKIAWGELGFVIPPDPTMLMLSFIDCESEEKAKEYFLLLRLRRIPDYARSGKFLIKADKESFKWVLQYFGAERYSVRRNPFIW
jgi:hypothetical protein